MQPFSFDSVCLRLVFKLYVKLNPIAIHKVQSPSWSNVHKHSHEPQSLATTLPRFHPQGILPQGRPQGLQITTVPGHIRNIELGWSAHIQIKIVLVMIGTVWWYWPALCQSTPTALTPRWWSLGTTTGMSLKDWCYHKRRRRSNNKPQWERLWLDALNTPMLKHLLTNNNDTTSPKKTFSFFCHIHMDCL